MSSKEKNPKPPERLCPRLNRPCIHEKCGLWAKIEIITGSPLAPTSMKKGTLEGCSDKLTLIILQLIINSGILDRVNRG